jgi:hypothetical protein
VTGPAAAVRPARRARRAAASLVLLAAVGGGLAGWGWDTAGRGTDAPAPAPEIASPAPSPAPGSPPAPAAEAESVAGSVRSLPAAPAVPEAAPAAPAPTALTIDSIGVSSAAVRPVGVEPDGDMEIPAASEVGWYRFGPRPGEAGSAVLAAHIAYDGVDGVFRHLEDLQPGDGVTLGFDDGTTQRFVVTRVAQYDKAALPDETFARDGDPQMVLITCGGDFDSDERRYEDNVVAITRPA